MDRFLRIDGKDEYTIYIFHVVMSVKKYKSLEFSDVLTCKIVYITSSNQHP
jgi:hypothetical protein